MITFKKYKLFKKNNLAISCLMIETSISFLASKAMLPTIGTTAPSTLPEIYIGELVYH